MLHIQSCQLVHDAIKVKDLANCSTVSVMTMTAIVIYLVLLILFGVVENLLLLVVQLSPVILDPCCSLFPLIDQPLQ